MCGIFCSYNYKGDIAAFRPRCVAMSKKLRHRGPDWSGTYVGKETILCHERLAIVGVGKSGTSEVSNERADTSAQIRELSPWFPTTARLFSRSTVKSTTTSL